MSAADSSLEARRRQAATLLNPRSPADALAVYYALHSPADRTQMWLHTRAGATAGFLVSARTGMDLFRPLVTLRADSEAVLAALLAEGLAPGRPVYLTVPEALGAWANKHLHTTEAELHRIYRLRPERHQPLLNIHTVISHDPSGGPRCEIRPGGELGAVAGVNWQSPHYSEIYVYTDPAVRGRGWGKAVVATLAGLLLKAGRQPLYVVADSNDYSIRLAEAVGFEDTGSREFVAQAALSA